jgi:hypothetical protein
VSTLLIAFVVVAALLGLSIRFGPHVMWKTVHSDISSGVAPMPSKPLVDVLPTDDLVMCKAGPVSFELPESMGKNVAVHRGIGGVFLQFHDDDRSLSLELPQRDDGLLQFQIEDFPDKSKLTFPRLYKEIADAQSSDFSFGMSHRELRWHKWLLKNRSQISIEIGLIEFLWRPDLEGNLLSFSSVHTFQWATTDRQWEGTMYFKCSSRDDVDWIRHVCAKFDIEGDPNVFHNRDDATIVSMINFTQMDERGRTKR